MWKEMSLSPSERLATPSFGGEERINTLRSRYSPAVVPSFGLRTLNRKPIHESFGNIYLLKYIAGENERRETSSDGEMETIGIVRDNYAE